MATFIGLIDFAGYPFVAPARAAAKRGHGKTVGGKRIIQAMLLAEQHRYEQENMRIVQRQDIRRAALLAEQIRMREGETLHQEHVKAAAAWTVLMAEI